MSSSLESSKTKDKKLLTFHIFVKIGFVKNGHFGVKNGHFGVKNGHFGVKNGHFDWNWRQIRQFWLNLTSNTAILTKFDVKYGYFASFWLNLTSNMAILRHFGCILVKFSHIGRILVKFSHIGRYWTVLVGNSPVLAGNSPVLPGIGR